MELNVDRIKHATKSSKNRRIEKREKKTTNSHERETWAKEKGKR